MIFVNMALIDWLSKKQDTVEKAIFRSEFVAMTHGVETLCGIRYKLRMMGKEAIPINAPPPRSKEVLLITMVDSDHAGDDTYCRSRTSYMIYVNMALIDCLSKTTLSTVACFLESQSMSAMLTNII